MLKKKLGIHAIERDWEVPFNSYRYYKIPSTLIIPEGCRKVGRYAFRGCWWLERVVFPEECEVIGNEAFAWCRKLREVIIPGSVRKIEIWAFYGCENAEIKLGKLKKSRLIERRAFRGCKKLMRE